MYQLLIIDDERKVTDSLAETLPWEDLNISQVYRAYSGNDALQLLAAHSIEIILTDIRMPGISGLELIQKLREMNKRTKCIIHSGYSDFEYAKQAMMYQVTEYLLKPASDEEILEAVGRMINEVHQESVTMYSVESMTAAIREQIPVMRSQLLHDLLKGKKWVNGELSGKLEIMGLSFRPGDSVAILVIRLEEGFSTFDLKSLSLFEYAIMNIAEETFGEHFDLLTGRDEYDYLVFMVKLSLEKQFEFTKLGMNQTSISTLLEKTALKLQENVKAYLKRHISIVMSTWGNFPEQTQDLYQQSISMIRRNIGNDSDIFLRMTDTCIAKPMKSLRTLYETPTLNQMLDMGHRQQTFNKIEAITAELEEHWSHSHEHLQEVFLHLAASFTYAAHQNGKPLEEIIGADYEPLYSRKLFLSFRQLRDWALRVASRLFDDLNKDQINSKSNTILQIQQFINQHLTADVTLQAIADHVSMHPAYLSKIFKARTGENLSDYIIKLKMEKAAILLKQTDDKIYQICAKLGYQNPPYLIKLFKKYYGVTPQEYRDGASQKGD